MLPSLDRLPFDIVAEIKLVFPYTCEKVSKYILLYLHVMPLGVNSAKGNDVCFHVFYLSSRIRSMGQNSPGNRQLVNVLLRGELPWWAAVLSTVLEAPLYVRRTRRPEQLVLVQPCAAAGGLET